MNYLAKHKFFHAISGLLLGAALLAGCGGTSGKQEAGAATAPAQADTLKPAQPPADTRKVIMFFGNSLTAGYGLDPQQAFPALLQHTLDSLALPYRTVNAGLSGETTAAGTKRIGWLLKQRVDILVIELGGNDGLRGISPDETKKNLQDIIDQARAAQPDIKIVLAGMEAPPNMGQQFTANFRALYAQLAKANQVALIPFLLEGVGGEPRLNLPDGIHPTAEGHQIVAATVWKVLKGVL